MNPVNVVVAAGIGAAAVVFLVLFAVAATRTDRGTLILDAVLFVAFVTGAAAAVTIR